MFWPWFLHIQMLTQKRTLCQRKRKPPPSMWECWMEASALTTCFRRSPLKVLMNIYLLYKAICATGKCSFLFGGFSDSSVKLVNHVRLCDPVDCSTPGFPVHHQLLELTQTQVHRVSDAIQPSHPLSSPFLPTSVFPSIRVFSNESVLRIRWPKYWSFSFSISPARKYLGLISFRIDWFDLSAVQGTLKSLFQ